MGFPYQGTADPVHTAPEGTLFLRTDTNTVFRNTDGGTTWVAMVDGDDTRLTDSRPPVAHAIGGADHTADTLANLNSKVSDATLDDSGDPRDPNAHTHLEADITDLSHVDPTAIHDDVANEISAIADKAAPVAADILIIEDSEAAGVKKKVSISNLPGGGASVIEHEDSDESTSAKGSTAYGTAKLASPHVYPAGDYIITWSIEINSDSTGKVVDAEIRLDGTPIGEHHVDVGTVADAFDGKSGFLKTTLTAANHDIDIFWRLNPAPTGATARIRRVRIAVYKV